MKAISKSIGAFFFLLLVQAMCPLLAQERSFQMFQAMDLPREFNPDRSPSCKVEFQEEWIIDPASSSILKTVKSFEFPCDDGSSSATLPDGTTRLKNLSFEFSFLDLPEQMAKEIQMAIIDLLNKRYPLPEYYDPQDQLLSIYFHEDWSIESGHKTFTKKVRGLTPIIWQRRQTADGEPLLDPDTGYPVFYKLELERIDLRQP
jgi:hypothetical protein